MSVRSRAYDKAVKRGASLVYLEDQYFWSGELTSCFAKALTANPGLQLIIVVPHFASQDGLLSRASALLPRAKALQDVLDAGPGRVGVYGIENHSGTPIYVHTQVCVVDDVWATIGSDNVNRRSWTHDSELTCGVYDTALDEREPTMLDAVGDGARRFARNLRLQVMCEHLDRTGDAPDVSDLIDPKSAFAAFAESAARLQAWYDGGRRGVPPCRTPASLRVATLQRPHQGRRRGHLPVRQRPRRTPGRCGCAAPSDRSRRRIRPVTGCEATDRLAPHRRRDTA